MRREPQASIRRTIQHIVPGRALMASL